MFHTTFIFCIAVLSYLITAQTDIQASSPLEDTEDRPPASDSIPSSTETTSNPLSCIKECLQQAPDMKGISKDMVKYISECIIDNSECFKQRRANIPENSNFLNKLPPVDDVIAAAVENTRNSNDITVFTPAVKFVKGGDSEINACFSICRELVVSCSKEVSIDGGNPKDLLIKRISCLLNVHKSCHFECVPQIDVWHLISFRVFSGIKAIFEETEQTCNANSGDDCITDLTDKTILPSLISSKSSESTDSANDEKTISNPIDSPANDTSTETPES